MTGPKPETMVGMDFSPEGILRVKDAVSRLRDEALRQQDWDTCVLLTHTVIYLNDYARIIRQSSEKPIKAVGDAN